MLQVNPTAVPSWSCFPMSPSIYIQVCMHACDDAIYDMRWCDAMIDLYLLSTHCAAQGYGNLARMLGTYISHLCIIINIVIITIIIDRFASLSTSRCPGIDHRVRWVHVLSTYTYSSSDGCCYMLQSHSTDLTTATTTTITTSTTTTTTTITTSTTTSSTITTATTTTTVVL